MARMKLAIGPAATMAARLPSGWWKKLSWRSPSLMPSTEARSGALATFSSPKNLTYSPKTYGKHQHAHAAPARDQEMTQLVDENHDGQDEQERNDQVIKGRQSAQSADAAMKRHPDLRPHGRPAAIPVP